MKRRTAQLALLILVLFLPITRAELGLVWQREDVQSYVAATTNRGAQATVALVGYVRKAQVTYVGGKPVVAAPDTQQAEAVDTTESWNLDHGCSLTADEVEAVLKAYNSPAVGQEVGAESVKDCNEYGIDNAYWLAQFIHESTAGTAPTWAGQKGGGETTANTGNVSCVKKYACYGRFADFENNWAKGTMVHFQLLACYKTGGTQSFCDGLYRGKAHRTIDEALNTWAPPTENDVNQYTTSVKRDVANWRSVHTTVATTTDRDLRKKVVELALSRQGDPYVSGARSAGGSDCSGFVQYVYKTATGIDPGYTTFDQWPNLKHIELKDVQNGDLWYGRWNDSGSWDSEHTGIVADVDGDGKPDLIHNGWDQSQVHVTSNFLETDLKNHTLGFASILGK